MMIECIIKVVFEVLVEQRGKDLVHEALEARWGIHKSKGHNAESEGAKWSHKCSLPFITGLDADLVVTGFQVKLHEDFQSVDVVHHLIDAQKQVTVLDRNVIEFVIVDDRLAGPILFPNEEHWSGNWTI